MEAGSDPGLFLNGNRARVKAVQSRMSQRPDPEDIITEPLTPKPVDGGVEVKDPPEAAMNLTADAAEISGLRMLDAADQARKQR